MEEYKLKYTAAEIDEKLEEVSRLSQEIVDLKENAGGSSVQPDYAQTDSTQPDFIKNKIVGDVVEYGDTLTWDGDTDGLDGIMENQYFHVSDNVPTVEDVLTGTTIVINNGGTETSINVQETNVVSDESGVIMIMLAFPATFLIIPYDNYVLEGEIFPKKGIYLASAEIDGIKMYASSLTIHGYSGFATKSVKKLAPEYMEPFEVVTTSGDTLTWDGNTEGLASFANYYKVSDTIVTIEDLQNGGSYSTNSYDSNIEMTNDFDSSFFTEITDGVCFAGGIFAVSENGVGVDIGGGAIFSEPGIYFQDAEGIYISALTISNYSGFVSTSKKIKENYLPDSVLTVKAVRYDEQSLSEAQKTQARNNIGAASAEEVSAISQEIADYVGGLESHLSVHCPSPQLPANAESGSDFNIHTFADFGAGYHSYFDDLVARYPHYLVREYLGKDASETLPMYRYTLGNHYWNAWYKENYPRMYAWKNDSKVIYSKSVSPRIGDVMYEQGYIGATYGGGQPAITYVKPKAVIIRKKRYSLSGKAFKDFENGSAVIFPLFAEGITDSVTVEMTNMQISSSYKEFYAGATNTQFTISLSSNVGSGVKTFTVGAPSGGFTESHNYGIFTVMDTDGWEGTLDPATATLTVNGIEMELIISTDVADASLASPSKTEQSGTSEGYPITAVSATNRSRTVNGLEFVRYPDGDVEPTLLYTELVNTKNVTYGYTYDANWERQANVAEYGDGTMISGGTTYIRYPYGDLRKDKTKPIHMTIIANEHGGDSEPAIPAVVTARLIRDLCQGRHSDNPVMSFLRDDVQLTIIPVVNPHGLNRYAIGEYNGYQNVNGININRNYDTPGWDVTKSLGAAIDTTDACGDYAGSENETQYVMNTMVDSEAVVAMSVHTISCHVTNHERCNYQGQNPNGAYTQEKIEDIRTDMKISYNLNFLPYDPLECPPDTTSKSPSFITQCGAYGGIVEFQCHDPLATDEEISTDASMFTDVVMEQNYSLLLKFIAMWLSDYLEK